MPGGDIDRPEDRRSPPDSLAPSSCERCGDVLSQVWTPAPFVNGDPGARWARIPDAIAQDWTIEARSWQFLRVGGTGRRGIVAFLHHMAAARRNGRLSRPERDAIMAAQAAARRRGHRPAAQARWAGGPCSNRSGPFVTVQFSRTPSRPGAPAIQPAPARPHGRGAAPPRPAKDRGTDTALPRAPASPRPRNAILPDVD